MKATVMDAAGDVRVEKVPDPRLVEPTDALVRITPPASAAATCGRTATMAAQRARPPDRARVHRRRRGRRGRGAHAEARRPGRRPVRVVRRDLRVLPRGSADVMPARRLVGRARLDGGQGEAVRVPLADGTLVELPGGGDRRADAVAADPLRRDGHRPPRGRRGAASRRATRSPSSATAPSACAACSRPSGSAPSRSSLSAATRTA